MKTIEITQNALMMTILVSWFIGYVIGGLWGAYGRKIKERISYDTKVQMFGAKEVEERLGPRP